MQRAFNKPRASALIYGGSNAPSVYGKVDFFQKNNSVLVVADIGGLPKNDTGFYGFHIHEGTDCKGEEFSGSKGHYNPEGKPHPNHAGDLPPLLVCGDMAHLEVLTCRFKTDDIIGRTVIIHNMPDDFKTQPSGNAGVKIACGVIKRKQ